MATFRPCPAEGKREGESWYRERVKFKDWERGREGRGENHERGGEERKMRGRTRGGKGRKSGTGREGGERERESGLEDNVGLFFSSVLNRF